MTRRTTRRRLFAAAAGAALVRPAVASAEVGGDAAILRDLIAREDAAAAAYRSQARPSLFALAAHEGDHAKALRTHLAALGHQAAAAGLDASARRVARARGAVAVAAAIALEESLLAAYRDALVALVEPSILRTAGTIMASHAQHRVLLLRSG